MYSCEKTGISNMRTIQPGPSVRLEADYGRGLVRKKCGSNLGNLKDSFEIVDKESIKI